VRASRTRYTVVDRLLEQLPRERLLGVVLNRADTKPEDNTYYYQPRRLHSTPAAVEETVIEDHYAAGEPEMIYIEEDGVS
jgi:hypothetical protein